MVTKRWSNIRDAFAKFRKKMKEATATGSRAPKMKKYVYNDQLQFLLKVYDPRQTADSFETEEKEEGNGEADISVDEDDPPASDVATKVRSNSKCKRKLDEVEQRVLQVLEKTEEPDNRHMCFFKGILPSLELLDEESILKFQCTVLKTISDLNQERQKKTRSPRKSRNFSSSSSSELNFDPLNYTTPSHPTDQYSQFHPPVNLTRVNPLSSPSPTPSLFSNASYDYTHL